jgi:arylsulfatase A-like enzyme
MNHALHRKPLHRTVLSDMASASLAMFFVCIVDLAYSGSGLTTENMHVLVYLAGWHLGLGLFVGSLVTLGRPATFLVERLLVRRWKTGPGLLTAGLALGVVVGTLVSMWIYRAGVEVRALPWHVLIPCLVFLLPFMGISKLLEHRVSVRGHGVMVMALAFGISLSLIGSVKRVKTSASIPDLLTQSITSRLSIQQARAAFDSDTDGYPTRFCMQDCDCDDGRRRINPGAVERLDNGVDEDCDGADLAVSQVAVLFGGTPVVKKPHPTQAGSLQQEQSVQAVRPPNVILLVVDTLRADHLSLHGYERKTTPRLDELSKQAVVFTQARAQGSMTRESLAPILTGRYYTELARDDVKWPTFFEENVFVPEILRDKGFRTWGISSFIYVVPKYGFGQGLSELDTRILSLRSKVHWNRTSDLVTDFTLAKIDEWEASREDQPFYIMSHYADPHSGYQSHKESPRFGGYTADLYDEEIFYTDMHLGRLFDGLDTRGLMDNTIVVLTSDHGEGLAREKDHGHIYHGQHLYDNLIHVPLIAWVPGAAGRRVDEPVATIDIVPTLLQLTGVEHRVPLSGVSLVPWIEGREKESHPPVVSQKVQPVNKAKLAMISWPHKLIWNIPLNTWELYEISTDPHELDNLVGRIDETIFQRLQLTMKAWRAVVAERTSQVSF